ncbi:kinase-like protein [Aureobasidium pullulans]|nr:kinase-like protein [Aureobasidium pullulans]
MSTASRPYYRHGSPLSVFNPAQGFAADAPMMQRIDVGDSSDDEIPPPMKFSALTRALLESEEGIEQSSPKQDTARDYETPSRAPQLKIVRKSSPTHSQIATSPRIVSVSKRNLSSSRHGERYASSRENTPALEFVTPAPASRSTRSSASRSASNPSPALEPVDNDASQNFGASQYDASTRHMPPSTLNKTRHASAESSAHPGSVRVKRAPGAFLRGAPVRRGFRRRESDDNVSPQDGSAPHSESQSQPDHDEEPAYSVGRTSRADSANADSAAVSRHDFARSRNHSRDISAPLKRDTSTDQARVASRASTRVPSMERPARRPSVEPHKRERSDSLARSNHGEAVQRRPSNDHMAVRPVPEYQRQTRPSSRTQHDATEDQENIPPPTFKRDRHHDFKYLGKPDKLALHVKSQPVEGTPISHQSPRRALTTISNNTPVRPAPPPPPKMSVLDAATKTAGASTTKSKKRRQHILINGKLFTQMNKVGKGGSSDVYCVMAENYKLFALKKVKLEDCDESAMRGFKGEIDLLTKLADVERVIRLFDWELDNEKQILSVLMEKGDQDLNRILTIALNGTDPKFDPVLTRFYWKEMLECVQAVHDYDIVHSDLKPANFLSVQGKLKLIDFGIANAIDIAHTVNVHRDSHIGTPNYMSPESILDTNAPTPGSERTSNNGSRLMKIGKPSDVWSLGCILYQMVYGRPPFAHIANQISRIMAITNSKVVIEFPDKGVGGVTVPSALKGTLRRCLQRDLHARPTVKQLLSLSDPWLYPDVGNAVAMSEDLLAQIIDKVVERCKDPKRGIPSPDEVKQYPASFMSKIREMVEREGVVG